MKTITVSTTIRAPIERVWESWTAPEHITQWNNASDEWETPWAENDVRTGGKFKARMAARDGSAGFDFEGTYTRAEEHKALEYSMPDGRQVRVRFEPHGETVTVTEEFDMENTHSEAQQREGWQAILDNFKAYTESPAFAQKIVPCLWFDDSAAEAVNFYRSVFKSSRIGRTARYDEASAKVSGRPAGSVLTIDFELQGQRFLALNGGPTFKFNPSISLFLHCDTATDVDSLFAQLSAGGEVMMPLDKYPFSERYAFFKDRFGVSWQVILSPGKHHIAPCLLFVGKNHGNADAAVKLYTKAFTHARVEHTQYYEGTTNVMHSSFFLEGQEFMAMDGEGEHRFDFNEAMSFVVNCDTQQEIDYFWEKLGEGGDPSAQVCGWLKDRFGVSWQVVPRAMERMMSGEPAATRRTMAAMLQMKKLDIAALQAAHDGMD